jgi:hypothetical protein
VGGVPPTPGLQENSTSGLWLSQGLSLFAAALEMPNSLAIPEGKQYRVRRKPLPRKNRLTMPPAQTALLYQVPLSRTLIFSASGLYGFCSSAFPESLLLDRKSLSENFRLWFEIKEAARLLKIPL